MWRGEVARCKKILVVVDVVQRHLLGCELVEEEPPSSCSIGPDEPSATRSDAVERKLVPWSLSTAEEIVKTGEPVLEWAGL